MSGVLRDVFEERSAAEPDDVTDPVRLAGVHRRIARARRRRVATAGVAAAAVAALVGVTTPGLGDQQPAPAPPLGAARSGAPSPTTSPTGRMLEGFPEYLNGARVVAAASATRPDTTATLTFVPATSDLVFVTRCSPPGASAQLSFPNGSMQGGLCGSIQGGFSEQWLKSRGLQVGKPAMIQMKAGGTGRPAGRATGRPAPPSETGTIAVAVAVRVPFEEYPLPSPPATVPPLAIPADADSTVRSAPGDPLAARTVEVAARQRLTFFAQLSTPGSLRVLADGREVTRCAKWDYAATAPKPSQIEIDNGCLEELVPGDSDRPGSNGDTITVTVEPRHVTGDWAVHISS